MHINLDHEIFRKKSESRKLDIRVRWFLRKHQLTQPIQIPIGQSGYREYCEEKGIDPYAFSLRTLMTQSVEKAHSSKSSKSVTIKTSDQEPEPVYTPDLSPNRIRLNREARSKAWANGDKKFNGKCLKHGDQLFNIRKEGKDHMCCVCNHQIGKTYRQKQKNLKLEAS